MSKEALAELEKLITGKTDAIEIITSSSESSREILLEEMNDLLVALFPGCWLKGEFVNNDNTNYLVYDCHLSGIKTTFSSIRFVDFGDRVRVIKF